MRSAFLFLAFLTVTHFALAFTFLGSGRIYDADTGTHVTGYEGKKAHLEITVGLHADFAHLEGAFELSARQSVAAWNRLMPMEGNLQQRAEIPEGAPCDVWGVMLHELGHALGLGHPNLANLSPVGNRGWHFALSTKGSNNRLDVDEGKDGLAGTGDDGRGDDESLNYVRLDTQNPFALPKSGRVDSKTYGRDLSLVREGPRAAALVGQRVIAEKLFGLKNSEVVMVGGGALAKDTLRRGLSADDVAGIRYAMSGLDELAGTSDDYTFGLRYVGVDSEADIVVRFDHASGFAVAKPRSKEIAPGHRALVKGNVVTYNPRPPRGRFWMFPVLKPVPLKALVKNGDYLKVQLATVTGRRYAISWTKSGKRGSFEVDQVHFRRGGKLMKKRGFEYVFFVAESSQEVIEVKLGAEAMRAPSSFLVAYELEGVKLEQGGKLEREVPVEIRHQPYRLERVK